MANIFHSTFFQNSFFYIDTQPHKNAVSSVKRKTLKLPGTEAPQVTRSCTIGAHQLAGIEIRSCRDHSIKSNSFLFSFPGGAALSFFRLIQLSVHICRIEKERSLINLLEWSTKYCLTLKLCEYHLFFFLLTFFFSCWPLTSHPSVPFLLPPPMHSVQQFWPSYPY